MLSGGSGGGVGGAGAFLQGAAAAAASLLGPQASDEVQAQRRAICEGCELYTLGALGATCGSFGARQGPESAEHGCGCVLAVKIRGSFNACPRGKWT